MIVLFGSGGLGGIFLGNATADIQLHDTYFVVGHFHLMIGGVTLFALYASLYFWFPKMFGRHLSEKLGKAHFWLTFAPFYTLFLMQHFVGLGGTPRRYFDFDSYEFLQGMQGPNRAITWIAFLLGTSQILFIANAAWSLRRGRVAGTNPWNATTLEWTLPSPPPHGNWTAALPVVHRWPYEYSAQQARHDFTPQTIPAAEVPATS
jgi:cytochrome c oxidase subunit 1